MRQSWQGRRLLSRAESAAKGEDSPQARVITPRRLLRGRSEGEHRPEFEDEFVEHPDFAEGAEIDRHKGEIASPNRGGDVAPHPGDENTPFAAQKKRLRGCLPANIRLVVAQRFEPRDRSRKIARLGKFEGPAPFGLV